MIEVAMVFDKVGKPLFWLGPNGSSAGAIEDSNLLWDRIWSNKDTIGGVVHTHPWNGEPSPSHTDVTTWNAIERGLGMRLVWPIVTMTTIVFFGWNEDKKEYTPVQPDNQDIVVWEENIKELRRLSQGGSHG